jgi:hypothetical protein
MKDTIHYLSEVSDDGDKILYLVRENSSIKKGWYPQRRSFNSWKINIGETKTGIVYGCVNKQDRARKSMSFIDEKYDGNWIIVRCRSVWDFYDLTGYDYKKKKVIYDE